MIPLLLKLTGFLSYREPVEVDFTSFHLACISGSNGAGKSSLIDAMTWALFGQARKRDESVVNLQSKVAEVVFTLSYEETVYRVLRSVARGKTTTLEFQILDNGQTASSKDPALSSGGQWRPLTERSTRETQARIEQVLRLDYETFINVSFFLQGHADQFAQQPPARRKEILGNILGLETWEVYKERAANHRKSVERDLDAIDGRLQEIDTEVAEEPQRLERLATLEADLKRLTNLRKIQESALVNVKLEHAAIEKKAELVTKVRTALERSRLNLAGLRSRLAAKETERAVHAKMLARAAEVESAYEAWQSARKELERWDGIAAHFHEHEKRRQPFLDEIHAEKAKLEQERTSLLVQAEAIRSQQSAVSGMEAEATAMRGLLVQVEAKYSARDEVLKQTQEARERQAELRAENSGLKSEMDGLKGRIEKLNAADGAACPLCGQSLNPEHRFSTLEQLKTDGKVKGDQWRTNKATLDELTVQITDLESQLNNIASLENERIRYSTSIAQLSERLETNQKAAAEWKSNGEKRLEKVTKYLEGEKYAAVSRKQLVKVDNELAALGYDASAHDAVRKLELQARNAEEDYRWLEAARAALKPLDDEIANLLTVAGNQQEETDALQKDHDEAAVALAAAEVSAPNLAFAEQALFDIQEQENRLNQEVGAARQKVRVLDDLRVRKKRLQADREEYALQIGRYKTLERAFGKDGVPALLIEQALPEIETKANELLDRLSEGAMSVRFVTQSAYKDKKRDDLKETLDIQISDGAGVRDYEMYSGGEAFRVNFAIRLALSEVLASRKGARLQMLVIDEGFGSQDALGRQRLIQAINAVQDDFAKILVITHLEELKDAFPTRIEVDKTEMGSTVTVI